MRMLRCSSAFTGFHVAILCLFVAIPLLHVSSAVAQSDAARGTELLLEIAARGDDLEGASAFYDSLSVDDQAILMWGWENMTTEAISSPESSEMGRLSSGCTSNWATQAFYSLGVEQFSFSSGTGWCWSGATITDVWSLGTRPESSFLGWQYDGIVGGEVENWGQTAYKFSQTEWNLCYSWCIQQRQPWIARYGEADYAFWWNSGGAN